MSVEVSATSANLGPGFDCFGLALDWRDRVEVSVTDHGFSAEVSGEGAGELPVDASHLVISCVRRALRELGVEVPGLRIRAHNTIPHGRGLGSSSAAIVSGLRAGVALAGADVDEEWLLRLATEIEGHPDNVAAAVHGGFVLAYEPFPGRTVAIRAAVQPGLAAVVFVPDFPVSTRAARGLLPAEVPHREAAADAGRAALLVHALAQDASLLFDGTRDWLHQHYRRSAMEPSYALLESLRADRVPAVVSGAGPTILALGTVQEVSVLARRSVPGFSARPVEVGDGVRVVEQN